MTLTGNFGIRVELIETTGSTTTGTYSQTYQIETSVGDISIGTTDVAVSLAGYVGANSYQLNLNNVANYSGAGTGIDVAVVRNQNVDFNNVKLFAVHNKGTSNNLILKVGTQSSWFATSDQVTLKPGMGVAFAYANQETVGVSTSVISIAGSAGSTLHEVYIVGN